MWRWPGKTKLTHLSDTVPQTGVTEHAITNAGRIYQTNDILGKDVQQTPNRLATSEQC
jgi:hypothetical protein